jgi:D-aminoacyl-tRNA deacylase
MRAVIQRVIEAHVSINNNIVGAIKHGVLILLGIETSDTTDDIDWLSNKIINMRIFNDSEGLMNKSLIDVDGNILLVSQFTLHALTKKGNRPSFIMAARPEIAIPIYEDTIKFLERISNKKIATGEFGADMQVHLINDGPVTIIIDSKKRE